MEAVPKWTAATSLHCTETDVDNLVLSKSQVAGVAGKEGDKYARDNRVMCMGERWVKLMRREGSSARWRRGTSSWGRSSSRVAEISSNSTRHALY